MDDPLDRTDYLFKEYVGPRDKHRPGCQFGSGFYRVMYRDGGVTHWRHFDTEDGAALFWEMLPDSVRIRRQRDECLDSNQRTSDATTPDVLDGEAFLTMPREQGMRELGVTDEADYARAYSAVESAIYERDNRESQGGVRAPVVIKRKGARGHLQNMKPLHDNPGLR